MTVNSPRRSHQGSPPRGGEVRRIRACGVGVTDEYLYPPDARAAGAAPGAALAASSATAPDKTARRALARLRGNDMNPPFGVHPPSAILRPLGDPANRFRVTGV